MIKIEKMDSKTEQEWQAEADAELMARYEELMTDAPRLKRAKKAAKDRIAKLEESVKRMKKVAEDKSSRK